jgi:hypothetical protein
MIKPISDDRMGSMWINTGSGMAGAIHEWCYAFVLQVGDEPYRIWYADRNNTWRFIGRPSLRRRADTDALPEDSVAQSVVDILNKQDNIADMSILVYLTKMGFNISHLGWWGSVKRWFRNFKQRSHKLE